MRRRGNETGRREGGRVGFVVRSESGWSHLAVDGAIGSVHGQHAVGGVEVESPAAVVDEVMVPGAQRHQVVRSVRPRWRSRKIT